MKEAILDVRSVEKSILLNGNFVKETDNKVKGFLSFNSQDLESDFIPPESFDISSFMQKRTLLYNHKLWLDEQGNAIPVGEVESLQLVKVIDDVEDSTLFAVKEIATGNVIDTFAKDRLSGVVSGDRGIWVIAKVEIADVWSKVLRRVLNGFSWSGKSIMKKVEKLGILVGAKTLMSEISLVFSPAHPNALLAPMLKSATVATIDEVLSENKPFGIFGFVFSGAMFDKDSAGKWLSDKTFDLGQVFEMKDGELVFLQAGKGIFEDSMRTVGISQGVQAIVGVLNEGDLEDDEKQEVLLLTQKLLGSNVKAVDKWERAMKKAGLEGKGAEAAALPSPKDAEAAKVSPPVVAEAKVEVKTEAKTEEVKPSVETTSKEDVKVETKVEEVKVEAPVVAATETKVEAKVEAPVKEVKTEVTPKVEEAAKTEVKVDEVKPDFAAKAETPEVKPKREEELISEHLRDKMSVIVTQISETVNQKLDGMTNVIAGALDKFSKVSERLSSILEAQSSAVHTLLQGEGVVAVAKSATEKIAEVEALKAEIGELKQFVTSMQKTAIPSPVREEPKKATGDEKATPNDIFGSEFWPFKK